MDNEVTSSSPGIEPGINSYRFTSGKWQKSSLPVPKEKAFSIYVNTLELVTILCTPTKLNCLVLGYLFAEGIIDDIGDVVSMRVCEEDTTADVKLGSSDFKLPEKRMLTSGCGGGVSFNANINSLKIESNISINPEQLLHLMKEMMIHARLYKTSGGIHTSAISDGNTLLAISEDIGRHNTLDKIIGECLFRKIPTRDKILLTSGRVSSEMLRKAAKIQAPLIASLTSPTDRAVSMASELGITLVGYARGSRLTVYANPARLQIPGADQM